MNFWYFPKDDEDDEIVKDAESIEEKRTQNETMKNQVGKDEAIKKMNSEEMNETEPVPYTAGQLIGLSRDIEAMIGDALGDVTKVKNF